MKYLPLIWAGLWRKRIRTILTLLSIVVAFALFGVIQGVTAALDDAIDGLTDESRLMIQSRVNIIEPLPEAYLSRLENVDGVRDVSLYGYFGGFFQDRTQQVNTGAVNIETFFDLFPEFHVPPEQMEAIARTRNGAIVGSDLMEKFGWKLGDRIPLNSMIWTNKSTGNTTWDLDIVGVYTTDEGLPADDLYIRYDYFDEARTAGNGTVALFMLRVDDITQNDAMARRIDDMFANSTNETQTLNENEYARAQVSQIGDINFFVNAIAGAVLFTLLFLTGNTMMQSVRERIPELAVLKTYGFSNGTVSLFIYAEAFLLCVGAALIGLGIAAAAFPSVFDAIGVLRMPLPWSVVAVGCAFAALLAIVSALPPAIRAQRASIVDALAGR
jgi:putative ABC transport system permease protein